MTVSRETTIECDGCGARALPDDDPALWTYPDGHFCYWCAPDDAPRKPYGQPAPATMWGRCGVCSAVVKAKDAACTYGCDPQFITWYGGTADTRAALALTVIDGDKAS